MHAVPTNRMKLLEVEVMLRPTPQLFSSCSVAATARLLHVSPMMKAQRPLRVVSVISSRGWNSPGRDNNGIFPNFAKKWFDEEAIGAEHGEGFSTYRPRGPLHVDVDYLNDRMQERGLQRIRYAMKPDEAFGLIFSWDNVLANTRGVKMKSWARLAKEEGKVLTEDPEELRQLLCLGVEDSLQKVLRWGKEEHELSRLTCRLADIYCDELSKVRVPMEGLIDWLEALDTAGVPCAVASTLDRISLLAALERMSLREYFQVIVTEEDGMESIAHRFLSAAVKLDRPPFKCVVFEDDPRGITAAHNCSMKAVALIGSHPAYELTQADLAVSSFSELSVINLRRLFANKGSEFMDLKKQPDEKKPQKRKLRNDTLF
ncbi:hypothetical protein O6H91_13G027700 [Diphasiastrum complanatum]|uniref:Uncharacterized protein n=2 Tax=Diphasiastrum complanatum TaxID=34168 RepID=A0ACC2BT71_DIPCM|nr:hypothetical protein O6H91_13G027700 [Diphasiastrum complanatum]KAJ7532977.1 hypothetical protein O6H91_13G027700 [Diphasiastrum complanatum]